VNAFLSQIRLNSGTCFLQIYKMERATFLLQLFAYIMTEDDDDDDDDYDDDDGIE
jgi:hypothetical protein